MSYLIEPLAVRYLPVDAIAANAANELVRIEVKTTQSKSITNVEITANEWRATEEHRGLYHLALVAFCLSSQPIIQFIIDPYAATTEGDIGLRPVRFQLTW